MDLEQRCEAAFRGRAGPVRCELPAEHAGSHSSRSNSSHIDWSTEDETAPFDSEGHYVAVNELVQSGLDVARAPRLADGDAAVWRTLEPLMMGGPDRRVRVEGVIVSTTDGPDCPPVVTRVWLDGCRTRLANDDGAPFYISDGSRTWWFATSGEAVPIESEGPGISAGERAQLAFRRTTGDIDVFGFGTPTGPIEKIDWHGRPAWTFRFEPPPYKPEAMHVVVDAATGLVLRKHFADPELREEWREFAEVSTLPADLFTWSGPVRTRAQIVAERDAEHQRDLARREQWFRDNVGQVPLDVRGPLSVIVNNWLADGRFFASIFGPIEAALTRRPRATTPWSTGMSEVDHRWSDDSWDWALSVYDDTLTPDELHQLQSQLGTRPAAN